MNGENANIAAAGTWRRSHRTNSAPVIGAENRFTHKKKRPHKPAMWWLHSFCHIVAVCIELSEKGVYDLERKQTTDV